MLKGQFVAELFAQVKACVNEIDAQFDHGSPIDTTKLKQHVDAFDAVSKLLCPAGPVSLRPTAQVCASGQPEAVDPIVAELKSPGIPVQFKLDHGYQVNRSALLLYPILWQAEKRDLFDVEANTEVNFIERVLTQANDMGSGDPIFIDFPGAHLRMISFYTTSSGGCYRVANQYLRNAGLVTESPIGPQITKLGCQILAEFQPKPDSKPGKDLTPQLWQILSRRMAKK